ncbi:MAG: cytidine deaminase [Trueperaceae bacterium]|nr:cytidine deaminase [Trueperaceae bacterium]
MSARVPSDLLAAARSAWANAYAPYSGFKVGAALRCASGAVFSGSNVENASFGLTRCAEQSAVQALVTSGERSFTEIVVFTQAAQPTSPCGACRQVLFEFAPEARVLIVNGAGAVLETSVRELIPGAFGPSQLAAGQE